jgi:hypothetical protein
VKIVYKAKTGTASLDLIPVFNLKKTLVYLKAIKTRFFNAWGLPELPSRLRPFSFSP